MRLDPSAARALSAARGASLTYREVGATAGQELPGGFRHVRRRWLLGAGRERFDAATSALLAWQMHRRAGFQVCATAPVATRDAVVVLGVGVHPLRLLAPCRVVYDVGEEHRAGFAYGTLPGHPEVGEEAFVVEHQPDDEVVLLVTAFSRAGTRAARLAGPLNRRAQDHVTARYARALRAAAVRG